MKWRQRRRKQKERENKENWEKVKRGIRRRKGRK